MVGAPWLRPDTDAQLDWYKYHDDSKPIVVWAFSEKRIDMSSQGVLGPAGEEPPAVCFWTDWGLVVDAHNGTFIVEGSSRAGSSSPVPCPSG